MNFGRGWLFIVPLLVFVGTAMLLSCGGGGSSASATPGPPGPSILSISICPGPPPPPTPIPSVTKTPVPSPTNTPTPCPDFTEASVPLGCPLQLHAVATLNNNDTVDITNDSTSNWVSANPSQLLATTIQGTQGIYIGAAMGPAVDALVSVPGLSSPPVSVTIGPADTCPTIVLEPPTPAPTVTPVVPSDVGQ